MTQILATALWKETSTENLPETGEKTPQDLLQAKGWDAKQAVNLHFQLTSETKMKALKIRYFNHSGEAYNMEHLWSSVAVVG